MTETTALQASVAHNAIDLLQGCATDPDRLTLVRRAVFGDKAEFDALRSWLTTRPASEILTGLGHWAIGAFKKAEPILRQHPHEPQVRALLGSTLISLGRPQEALELLATPASMEEAGVRVQALVRRAAGGDREATQILEGIVTSPGILDGGPWIEFVRGWLAERALQTEEAIRHYLACHEKDADHPDCTFHLARLLELKGDDDHALELYEGYLTRMPANPALLINLGILHEDMGEWSRAEACFRAVLGLDPTHARAQLFLADVEASKHMHYDEDLERREDKRNAVLRTPVTDFELSVRSRNCLAKMGIRTLGDLVRKTEAELLSYKNFGETSLMEIQQILHSKSLRLGMDQDELRAGSFGTTRPATSDLTDPRNRPISELELSVRSRRVIEVFKVRTIGDLCSKSEAELMACPNFGQTSLNEIKTKLDELGLALKG
jgi:DNA-directed RNA polymerase subunit alpha